MEEFEDKMSAYLQNPYVLTLNSATSGLTLALHMLKKPAVGGRWRKMETRLTARMVSASVCGGGGGGGDECAWCWRSTCVMP